MIFFRESHEPISEKVVKNGKKEEKKVTDDKEVREQEEETEEANEFSLVLEETQVTTQFQANLFNNNYFCSLYSIFRLHSVSGPFSMLKLLFFSNKIKICCLS